MSGRFSHPVLPGESLIVSMWRQGDSDTVLFQTTREDGVVVIGRGRFQPVPASRP
jgi:acyl dehydratase